MTIRESTRMQINYPFGDVDVGNYIEIQKDGSPPKMYEGGVEVGRLLNSGTIDENKQIGDIDNGNYIELQLDGTAPKIFEAGLEISRFSDTLTTDSLQLSIDNIISNTKERIPIKVLAGNFDFSAINLLNREWIFPDGTTSTDERPTRVIDKDGIVYLQGNFALSKNWELNDNTTDDYYIGDLFQIGDKCRYHLRLFNTGVTGDIKYIKDVVNYIGLAGTGITGDIFNISNNNYYVNLANTSVTGDIVALSNVSYYIDLTNTGVTGDISSFDNVSNYIAAANTTVNGIMNPSSTLEKLRLNGTSMSSNDVDQTVINLNNNTVINNGELNLSSLTRTSASTTAINALIARGWTVFDATVV